MELTIQAGSGTGEKAGILEEIILITVNLNNQILQVVVFAGG